MRASTRAIHARTEPEQTHDGCQGLKEKDGEENVLGDRRGRNRSRGPLRVANYRRRGRRQAQ